MKRSETSNRSQTKFPAPSLSGSIVKLMSLPPQEDSYFDSVLDIVMNDPGLTTRLLGLANSALLSSREAQFEVRMGLMRVGPRRFASVIIGGAVEELFETADPELIALLHHSRAVAALCRTLAAEFPAFGIDPHVAQSIGLLHNIGALVLAYHAPEPYLQILRRHHIDSRMILQAEREAFGIDHLYAGAQVAQQWSLPPIFGAVIGSHHAAPGERAPTTDAGTLILLSLRLYRVLACKSGDDIERGVAIRALLHAGTQLNLELNAERIEHILTRASEQLVSDGDPNARTENKAG